MSQHKIGDLYAYESFKTLGTITKRPSSLALYNIMPSNMKVNSKIDPTHKDFHRRVKKVDNLYIRGTSKLEQEANYSKSIPESHRIIVDHYEGPNLNAFKVPYEEEIICADYDPAILTKSIIN